MKMAFFHTSAKEENLVSSLPSKGPADCDAMPLN
jgi:hypothetical protein